MLLVSFSEIINIGAVLPFLGVLVAPEKVFNYKPLTPLFEMVGIQSPADLLLPLALFFGLTIVLTAALRLLLLWGSNRLSYTIGSDISTQIYRKTLYQPYPTHLNRNSSEIINAISSKTNAIIISLNLVMTLFGSVLMLITILSALFFVDPLVAITTFGGFGLIYLIVIRFTRKPIAIDSSQIAKESTKVIKSLQEGLGGIRDVLIDGTQETFCQIYNEADLKLRKAQGRSSFLSQFPRYGVEALGMLLIISLAYFLSKRGDAGVEAIPILGALALGAQRFLPAFQQAYGSWSGLQSSKQSVLEGIDLLNQVLPSYAYVAHKEALLFSREISIENLFFGYRKDSSQVLKGIDLSIPKGARVGVIGKTGGGKSTLIDVIMGLLTPSQGALKVDGVLIDEVNVRQWQMNVAHVPQSIFLSDSTIKENIAFGKPASEIDMDKVVQAARFAQLDDVINSWPVGYDTLVGERGIRLSGGQRQRIGIARALYKSAQVIIFDEATSALDTLTEAEVMKAIENLSEDLTLIMIAHRKTTLKDCELVVEISDGVISRVGSYNDVCN